MQNSSHEVASHHHSDDTSFNADVAQMKQINRDHEQHHSDRERQLRQEYELKLKEGQGRYQELETNLKKERQMFADLIRNLAKCLYHDGAVQPDFGTALQKHIEKFEEAHDEDSTPPELRVVQFELNNLSEIVVTFEILYRNLEQDNLKMKAAVEKVEEEIKLRMQKEEKMVDLVDQEVQTEPIVAENSEDFNPNVDFFSENNEKSIIKRHNQLNESDEMRDYRNDNLIALEHQLSIELLKLKDDLNANEQISRRLLQERVSVVNKMFVKFLEKEKALRGYSDEGESCEDAQERPPLMLPITDKILLKIDAFLSVIYELIDKLSGSPTNAVAGRLRGFPAEVAPEGNFDNKTKADLENLAEAFKKRKNYTGSLEIRKLFEKNIADSLIQLISEHLIWQLGLDSDPEVQDSETKELISLLQSMNNINKEFKSNWTKIHKLFLLGLNSSARIFSFLLELSLELLQKLVVYEPKMNPLIAKLKSFHAKLESLLLDKQDKGLAFSRLTNSASARQIESHFERLCSDYEEIGRFVEGEAVMLRLDVHG